MVILGGLELLAAGYLIKKHQDNKRDKQRIQEEAATLEEQQYRIFPQDSDRKPHRRHRSPSRGRQSREGRHSYERHHSYDRNDRKHKREDFMALPPQQVRPPQYPANMGPDPVPQHMRYQAPASVPPPQYDPATAPSQPPQDVKYGWTDDAPTQQPQGQDPNYPPTGWPSHWAQSQTPQSNHQPTRQRGEASRERFGRAPETSPHVRFAVPSHTPQPGERSPPPLYRS